jgi:hypothetical protein
VIYRRRNPLSNITVAMEELPDYASIPQIIDSVAEAERVFDVVTEDEILGCGANGCVMPLVDGRALKITQSFGEIAVIQIIGTLSPKDAEGFVRIDPQGVIEVPIGYAYVRERAYRMLTHAEQRRYEPELDRVNVTFDGGDVDDYRKAVRAMMREPALRAIARTMLAAERKGMLLEDVTNDNVAWRDETTLIAIDAEAKFVR